MATVFLNGAFVERHDARVSAFDAGLQHGVGLFETMLGVRDGERVRVLHLAEHLSRLSASARDLGLSDSLRLGALTEAVQRTADREAASAPQVPRLRLRLTITGGDLNLLGRTGGGEPRAQQPTLMIVGQPATEYPREMFDQGVLVTLADLRVSPFESTQGHKTLNYWTRLRELQGAAAKRAGEALVFGVTNHLVGGCVSNVFVVKAGALITPIARGEEQEVAAEVDAARAGAESSAEVVPTHGSVRGVLPSPVLPGIVRRWVMDWALAESVACRRRMLTLEDVLGAEEMFLTNSSWGVLPVTRVEAERIGIGAPGQITKNLLSGWTRLIQPAGERE
ncbi:Branched-chain-amino-acid aminotransferase [Phycisphaerales bacterium]|nr:Branched-chain-amino-acid aminotransferase [Phycisphaerales bacterium]